MVSIIIPYYNRKEKLNRALQSIYAQTYHNFEIIVVDDCSPIPPDFDSYEFTYIKNERNLGPGLSRNRGKSIAKGKYIVFLDSDDYFEKTYLEKCIAKAKSTDDFAFIYTKVGLVDENCNIISYRKEYFCPIHSIFPEILTLGRRWATSSCFWNSTVITSVDWTLHRAWEDYLFDIKASIHNNNVEYIDEILVFYDATGLDKLSKSDKANQAIEKSKSVNDIIKVITKNKLITSQKLKKTVSQLLIKSIYEVLCYSNISKKEVHTSVALLKDISYSKYIITSIIMTLPRPLLIKILNRYRYM